MFGLSGCAATFVQNQPRTVMFESTYEPDAVRSALVRVFNKRKVVTVSEESGRASGDSQRTSVPCSFTVDYTGQNAIVSMAGPTVPGDASQIDSRCDEEANQIGRHLASEVTRPEKTARKMEKRQRQHEENVARNNAWAAQANLAAQQEARRREELAAMPQPAPQVIVPPQAPEPQYVAPAAPAPVIQNSWSQHNSQSTSTTNIQTNTTVINKAAPEPERPPDLKALTCCHNGRGYVCPSTVVYAAACVQNRAELAKLCPNEPPQDRYCKQR